MTPAARTQAAIELLDAIVAAARDAGAAADTLIARYFSTRRYAGSKDRRAVRELVYAAIRRTGERPASGRAAMLGLAVEEQALAATFDGSAYGPASITPDEPVAAAAIAPGWLIERFAASDLDADEQAALIQRAPLDIRINRLKPGAVPEGEPIPGLSSGLRLPAGTAIEATDAWREGRIEVQDAGSQFVTKAVGAKPDMGIVDLCAGAGGKTLALAAAMDNVGHILACDTDRGRLSRLAPRATRAGVTIAETRLLDPGRERAALSEWAGAADAVLVDAPCSGTGTWRRNPEARWRLTPARLDRLIETQRHVLDIAADLVKPGGALVYVVCSLLDEEGAGQVAAFLGTHPGWQVEQPAVGTGTPRGSGLRLTPASDGTDGFFVARLLRPC